MKFGINITTFNRPEYLKLFFESFVATKIFDNTIINVTDDFSTDLETKDLLKKYIDYLSLNNTVNFYQNGVNLGSKLNYEKSLLSFESTDIDFVINLDSDCILHKNWLVEIKEIIDVFGENILCSSFFCEHHLGNPNNRLEFIQKDKNNRKYVIRDTLNGLGLCFPKKILSDFNVKTDKHFDTYVNTDLKNKYNLICVCTSVSYIQHIGKNGVNSTPDFYDFSKNFIEEK